jgi:MFS family permease
MDEREAERRERLSVVLVGSAHGISHFYMLVLPPLFVLFRQQWGLSFVQLGIALAVWNVTTVVAQTPMGILVDRIGARKLLVAALVLGAASFTTAGLMASYAGIIIAMFAGGIANAVYHPADYDLLHHTVRPNHVGRAFAIHSFVGNIGYGMAPALMLGLSGAFGLRAALIAGGLLGVIPAIPLAFARTLDQRAPVTAAAAAEPAIGLRALLTPTVIGLTAFFLMITLSSGGLQNFSIPALQAFDGLSLAYASGALTSYLVFTAIGMLVGGVLADRTSRHESVAFAGFFAMGLMLLAIGLLRLDAFAVLLLMSVAGFFGGLIYPSRDMLVRKAAPPGAMGRTFGIVTTGFNIGGTVGPLAYGWLMDSGLPRAVFVCAGVLFAITAVAPLLTERRRRRDAQHLAAAPASG